MQIAVGLGLGFVFKTFFKILQAVLRYSRPKVSYYPLSCFIIRSSKMTSKPGTRSETTNVIPKWNVYAKVFFNLEQKKVKLHDLL